MGGAGTFGGDDVPAIREGIESRLPLLTPSHQVFRVVTYTSDPNGNRKLDPGPRLKSQNEAEYWADHLRTLGYRAEVEKLRGDITANYRR